VFPQAASVTYNSQFQRSPTGRKITHSSPWQLR